MNQQKSLNVKNLIPGLFEVGKIKIGRKGDKRQKKDGSGEWQLPVKLDHFIVTTLDRGADCNFLVNTAIHKIIGEKPKILPIRLLFNDIGMNFQSRYSCYNGATVFCSGDGESAMQLQKDGSRKEVQCPCHRQESTYSGRDVCKLNGSLSCLIDCANIVGGVFKFRTTGYNSVTAITSSLALIKTRTGGILADIPLVLTVGPKACTNPKTGDPITIQVVCVMFKGSMEELRQKALEYKTSDAQFFARLERVEEEARKLISADAALIDEAGDISEEFYPEEPAKEASKKETAPAQGGTNPGENETVLPESETPEPEQEQKQEPEAAPAEKTVEPPKGINFDLFS